MRRLLLLLCLVVSFSASAQTKLPDFADIVEKHGAAVVNVSTTQMIRTRSMFPQFPDLDEDDPRFELLKRFFQLQPGGQRERQIERRSLGSGFIIGSDGYVLTNAHVVAAADEITVTLTDKREFRAKVIGSDRRTDVALIKIDASGLPKVTMGDPAKVRVGEWVVAIGSPLGFENSVTAGIVSAKGRSLPQESFVPFIQTDAAINPGNSGGPLFNLNGEVIGINSKNIGPDGLNIGLSFAIPIDVAMDVQNQLRSGGRVSRGFIGVGFEEVTKELAESFGLPKPTGALVNLAIKGGAADKAGIEATDIILKVDGKSVNSSVDLPRIVGATKPGSSVVVQVWRKGATRDFTVTVAEIPEEKVAKGERRGKAPDAKGNRLGLVLSELDAKQRDEMKLAHGLVVENVLKDGRADFRPGDILLAMIVKGVNTELKTVEQFNKLLAQTDKSSSITFLVRRGEQQGFLTVRGGDK
jgi:serine protease Do